MHTTQTTSPPVTGIAWSDSYALGEQDIDEEHRRFVASLDRLLKCIDAELPVALKDFEAHAMQHFAEEDRHIRSGYPGGQCHLDEHAAVLSSVAEVRRLVDSGKNFGVGRRLALELARWFREHTQAMDSGLVAWMQLQRLGGKVISLPTRRASPAT